MTDHTTSATVEDLARRHGLELLRFAYLLCGEAQLAEDLLQDVLLSLHRRYPEGLRLDNPVGYGRWPMPMSPGPGDARHRRPDLVAGVRTRPGRRPHARRYRRPAAGAVLSARAARQVRGRGLQRG